MIEGEREREREKWTMMMFQNVFAAVSIFLTTTASFNLLRSKLRGIGGSGGEETPAVAKDEPDAGVVIGDTVSLRTKPLDDTADVDKEDKATPPPDTTTIEAEPVLLSSRGTLSFFCYSVLFHF